MFDFAWSEIGLIAAVALILIGPKDMPVGIRSRDRHDQEGPAHGARIPDPCR